MNTILNIPNTNIQFAKAISFGSSGAHNKFENLFKGGETYVLTPSSLYFDKYPPRTLNKKSPQMNMRRYFTPFRRISQICDNSDNEQVSDGCKIITTLTKEEYKGIVELTKLPRDKRANFWLPGIIGIEETGEIKLHGKSQYSTLSKKIENGASLKNLIEKILTSISSKNTSDLVIAIGSTEADLDFLDPFKRLGLNPKKKDSFDKIKELPFKSAFICTQDTSKKLINKLENLAKKCNADGQLRFIIIRNGSKPQINKIAHAILLLQKAFCATCEDFSADISDKLKKILQYRTLNYRNKRLFPLFIDTEKKEKTHLLKGIKNFLMQNKATSALICCAILIPIYAKKTYIQNKRKI